VARLSRISLALALCAALPATALAGGSIRGLLVQRQSGEPILGASVSLDDGAALTASDERGRFRFTDVPAGPHTLGVRDPECAPLDTQVEVVDGQTLELDLALDARGEEDTEEVVIRSPRLESAVNDTVLEMEEVRKIPGTQGDVLKIVQSLPGVARGVAFGGTAGPGVIVRGSAPEDSAVLIDGFGVPMLYHFGGLKSVINSDLLKRIDFLPGGFGAEFGDAIGGVLDVQTQPCTHSQYDGYVELSMIDAGFLVQGPITSESGFLLAARRSTLDAWLPSVLDAVTDDDTGFSMTVAPVYYDFQAKLDWSPGARDRLTFFAFGSSDRLTFLVDKAMSGDTSLRGDFGMAFQFYRFNLGWSHAGESWQLTTLANAGWDKADVSIGMGRYMHFDVPGGNLRSDLEWKLAERWTLRAGLNGGFSKYHFWAQMPRMPKEGEDASGFENLELFTADLADWNYNLSGYVSVAWRPLDPLSLSLGLRLDGYGGPWSGFGASPRASARYRVLETTLLKLGVGLYQQPPAEDETADEWGNPDLGLERAIHYVVGLEQALPWHVQVEFNYFYKDMDRLVVSDAETIYSNDGRGRASGVELLVRRDLADGLFGWLSYTLMRSQRQDHAGEDWRLFDWDQTHILTLVAGYRLPTGEIEPMHGQRSGWEFGLRFTLVSGNPETPYLGGIYDADYDTYLGIPGQNNSRRLPLFHQLDFRLDYTWAWTNWALSVFLDIQNVYNHRNVEGVQYNYDYTDRTYFQGMFFLPALGLKGYF